MMKEDLHPRCVVQENARRIKELHGRVKEAFQRRGEGPEARAAWGRACEEFHREYDLLAFPGGYEAGLAKIRAGEGRAIEDALGFLEVRPYFFRSQYMRTKFTRLLKRAALSVRQAERFQKVREAERARSAAREV